MSKRSFLSRLARDKRGNTLAIMAAAIVPLIGFAGSAVDMARLYVVKTRLQQACDAGVLAGRKAMTDTSTSTALDSTATNQAQTFFTNNFNSSWYQTTNVSFTPSKTVDGSSSTAANAVTANASATVPMAVMGFFGMPARQLDVTCQARFDLADTDVMFVLDTTGSMSCKPSDSTSCANAVASYTRSDNSVGYANTESSDSKIEGVRKAVMLFDQTMRANADPTTHFRYGFVTYSSSVNVGKVIPSAYLQSGTWSYQSRHLSPTNGGEYNYGAQTDFSQTNVPQSYCVNQRVPATGFARTGLTWSDQGYYQARRYTNLTWQSVNGGTCTGKEQVLRALWRYEPVSTDISQYVASLTTGNAVVIPSRLDGLTSKWRGCIEEVNTSPDASFSLGSLPHDLDPDWKPSDAADKWRPMWPDNVWLRNPYGGAYTEMKDENIDETSINDYEDYTYRAGSIMDRGGSAACGMPAQRLQTWTAQGVSDYVHNVDFKPFGGTYHDVGMIWGTRMLSPDGVFGADTAAWPGRNDPSRNIVFMTDGNMAPSLTSYGLYGVEAWDNRVDGDSSNWGSDTARHNARFRIECDAAKKKGMTIYVVALGVDINDDLTYCASPGQTFQASSTDALTAAFKNIAQRVAMLRITR